MRLGLNAVSFGDFCGQTWLTAEYQNSLAQWSFNELSIHQAYGSSHPPSGGAVYGAAWFAISRAGTGNKRNVQPRILCGRLGLQNLKYCHGRNGVELGKLTVIEAEYQLDTGEVARLDKAAR